MVGEFPELQGIMGGYYARHDGETEDVAVAIEDHYKPRFAGDALPRGDAGVVVALADKLETLVGLFGIGQLPTGDKDPFALRRHALGVIRMLIERALPLDAEALVAAGLRGLPAAATARRRPSWRCFLCERLVGYLRELGYSAQEVDAVLGAAPAALGRAAAAAGRGARVRRAARGAGAGRGQQARRQHPEEVRGRGAGRGADAALFGEPAEAALHAALQAVSRRGRCRLRRRRLDRLAAGAGRAEGAGRRLLRRA